MEKATRSPRTLDTGLATAVSSTFQGSMLTKARPAVVKLGRPRSSSRRKIRDWRISFPTSRCRPRSGAIHRPMATNSCSIRASMLPTTCSSTCSATSRATKRTRASTSARRCWVRGHFRHSMAPALSPPTGADGSSSSHPIIRRCARRAMLRAHQAAMCSTATHSS